MSGIGFTQLLAAWFIAWLLLHAAWYKLRASSYYAEVLTGYGLGRLPVSARRMLARLLGLTEALVGAGLLLPLTRPPAAVAACGLLLLYAAVMALALLNGRRLADCGCGAPGQRRPLTAAALLHNVGMAAVAAWGSLGAAPVDNGAYLLALVVTTVAVLMYSSIGTLLANRRLWTEQASAVMGRTS